MNPSKIVALTLVGVVSALVLVQAGHYGGGHMGAAKAESHQALAHYGGGACHGHGCNNQAPRSGSHGPYGPYHSYAVRPVIYGGHGLYNYKGYARHGAPAQSSHRGRYARSYGMAPRARYASAGHHGNGAAARHYAAPSAGNHYAPAPVHQMRPIHAILLVTEHAEPATYSSHGNNAGGHSGRYARGASGYGSGQGSAYGASHYGATGNTRAHEQQYHHGGYRQNNNNNNNHHHHHAGGYNSGNNAGHY